MKGFKGLFCSDFKSAFLTLSSAPVLFSNLFNFPASIKLKFQPSTIFVFPVV